MAEANPTRVDLVEKLEKLVAEYNAGSVDAEKFFEALKVFVAGLNDEEQRAARERLTEEELAIFDLLTTPEPKLTKAQEAEVKRVARELLAKLRPWTRNSGRHIQRNSRAAERIARGALSESAMGTPR